MAVPEIVVGVDGSAPAESALTLAMAEAMRRHGRLCVITAYESSWPGAQMVDGDHYAAVEQEHAKSIVEAAVQRVHTAEPGLRVQGHTVQGQAGAALLEASEDAAAIVVGHRGRGGFSCMVLGSVAHQVATHAACPVVVARGRISAQGPVVVGVDGSPAADHALGLAFELAHTRGNRLIAVRALHPYLPTWGPDATIQVPYMTDPNQREKIELNVLSENVNPWREKCPDVKVELIVHQGHPAQMLAGMSHSASLVVVGSRGQGGFAGLLLGSVGLNLLHHADCPVVIDRVHVLRMRSVN